MDETKNKTTDNADDLEKIKGEADVQITRARANDYIAIILALGTVFILWLLQLMGLY